jgi:predicted AAA+ superfamily ATPase
MPSAIDYMNKYKGDGKPKPIIPIIGATISTITPYIVYVLLNDSITAKQEQASNALSSSTTTTMMKMDNILILLESMTLTSLLFFCEWCTNPSYVNE